MKYMKFLFLIGFLFLLIACNGNELEQSIPEEERLEGEFIIPESVGTVFEPIIDDKLVEILDQVELTFLEATMVGQNMVLVLRDLVTWDVLATYEFAESELISVKQEIGDGYFVVRMSPLFMNENSPDFPFIIFNKDLELVETVWFEGDVLPFSMDIIRKIDDELFVYGWGWSGDWDEWPLNHIEFLKVNTHTAEVEVLFTGESEMQYHSLHQFVNETQILTSSLTTTETTGGFTTTIGILDIELGSFIYEFDLESFAILRPGFYESKVLFSESRIAVGREQNKVLIFDINSREYQMISLDVSNENVFQESFWARLSYDGNHIVTVNEEESVFRKYDERNTYYRSED